MVLILTIFASPPVEMLAYMLKVAEGWPPTRSRLIREDGQSLNKPRAQLGVWPCLLFSLHRTRCTANSSAALYSTLGTFFTSV